MPMDPTSALRDLAAADPAAHRDITRAQQLMASPATAAQGRQLFNSALLKLRGKGGRFAGLAGALAPLLNAPAALPSLPSLPNAGDVVDAITPDWISGIVKALTSANLWLRVGQVLLGTLLIVVGTVKLTSGAAANVIPVGRVAKALR